MLIWVDQLDHEQLASLDLLSAQCKLNDHNTVPIYRHLLIQPRIMPSLLYYQDQELRGFVSPFYFYEAAVEIALMVSPLCRKQGIAKQMLKQILPSIEALNINDLIFSSVKDVNNKWLKSRGFRYQNSEYEMLRQTNASIEITDQLLSIRLANHDDITSLSAIDSATFKHQHLDINMRISTILNDRNYSLFIANLNGSPIGKVHVKWEVDGARFSDIAILPEHQGRGYGRTMLASCINYALQVGKLKLRLDVETNNENALKLYTKLGFSIDNACDYWLITLNALRQRCLD